MLAIRYSLQAQYMSQVVRRIDSGINGWEYLQIISFQCNVKPLTVSADCYVSSDDTGELSIVVNRTIIWSDVAKFGIASIIKIVGNNRWRGGWTATLCRADTWYFQQYVRCNFTFLHFNECIEANYRKISNISRNKSQNSNVSRLGLQLSLCNILNPGVKWRKKM